VVGKVSVSSADGGAALRPSLISNAAKQLEVANRKVPIELHGFASLSQRQHGSTPERDTSHSGKQ